MFQQKWMWMNPFGSKLFGLIFPVKILQSGLMYCILLKGAVKYYNLMNRNLILFMKKN